MSKKNKIKILLPICIIIITATLTFNVLTTYSLDEYTFTSPIYIIEDNYIKNISPKTTIDTFYQYFDIENCIIKVVDENNNQITDTYIYTGSITKIYNKNNKLITTYTNIVKGDITMDGLVDAKDINTIASNIINDKTLDDYYTQAIDMNNDGNIKANDIALLNSYLNKKYESLILNISSATLMSNETVRIILTINPNMILSQNLIWTSSNENIATVNNAGLVTAKEEGTATITATTPDGSLTASSTIIVDNTIKLSSTNGKIYIGGENVRVFIKATDYNGLTCTSSNDTLINCSIEDKYLIITLPSTTQAYNNATLTVNSPNHGSATYIANIVITYINLFPSEGCIPINSLANGTISSFDAGTLTFDISDTNIIKESYVKANRFYIRAGSIAGDATVTITESNGNAKKTFKATVYKLSVNKIGDVGKIGGNEIEATITAENTGNLTCSSEKEEVATCTIDGNILKVKPISKGQSNITITEDKCNSTTTFLAVVEGE